MAAAGGRAATDLTAAGGPGDAPPGSAAARLFAAPYAYNFFQAVRLLERLSPAAAPLGAAGPPTAEAVRFRVHQSLSFPPSQIAELVPPVSGKRAEMTVPFFGLTGPSGVLPRLYTERLFRLVNDAKAAERYALRDWFDLFNHRLLSLFYRAWGKYRLWLPHDRGEPAALNPDAFTVALRGLVGLATPGLVNRGTVTVPDTGPTPGPPRAVAGVSDNAAIFFAGAFSHRPRNASGLEAVLGEYLGLPVKVEPFRGQWLAVDAESRAATGAAAAAPLGSGPVLGERVWDVQSKFRVRVGPVGRADFDALLPDPTPSPGGKKFYLLLHLIRLYAGPEFDVEVQLVLKAAEVPTARLPRATAAGPRLGRNAWLTSMTPGRDAGDTAFTAAERPARTAGDAP